MTVRIVTCSEVMQEAWLPMRQSLWPYAEADHRADVKRLLENPDAISFLACSGEETMGFAEATIRRDYVNGCDTSPVGFLEGLYVCEAWRRRGVARLLCQSVEAWVAGRGCTEIASDTWLDHQDSQRMHTALGFSETERVVYFRKKLG